MKLKPKKEIETNKSKVITTKPIKNKIRKKEKMLLMKTLPSFVTQKRVTNGIIVAPNNHPEFGKLIELDTDIRDKVWNWIHNPTLQKKEDWIEIREHVFHYWLTAGKIMLEYGPSENKKIFRSMMIEHLNELTKDKS